MAATPRIVVIAVDASEHSREAFEWYMANIYRPDDELVLCHIPETPSLSTFSFKIYLSDIHRLTDHVVICHVPEIPYLPSFSFKSGLSLPAEEWKNAIEEQLKKVQALEQDYEHILVGRKIKYTMKGEACKNPGEGVIKVVDNAKGNLVVMGTRGLDPIRRTLLGSVSDYVVRHSKVPVLICPKQ